MRIEYAMNPVTPRHSYLGGSPICKRGLEEKIFKPDDGGMPLSLSFVGFKLNTYVEPETLTVNVERDVDRVPRLGEA